MPTTDTAFDQIVSLANEQGVEKTLDFLEHQFRKDKNYFKLFEVLKMRSRHRIGVPLIYSELATPLDDEKQKQLEDALIAACREVGTLLIKDGQIQEGWMYLQPVGDRELSEKLIRSIDVHEENIDNIIEIAVSQGAAPEFGYGLLLEHYGTCNAITTFDTQAIRFDRATQKGMAELLLRHLYGELCENIRHSIRSNEKTVDDEVSLQDMLTGHSWLVDGGGHHIDTTHLASVVRIARVVDQPADMQMALELAEYGNRLHEDFQYASPAPFESTYPDHTVFYKTLLGIQTESGVKHFEAKCESVDPQQYGPVAFETLADLLIRIGKSNEAIKVLTENVIGKYESMGIAPSILEIAKTESEIESVKAFYRSQDDLLGFAVGMLKSVQ